ncbi:MAG: protein kinase [Planctomycetes bacterium]|nr:protein kinase [Planctomycetota bacterium]
MTAMLGESLGPYAIRERIGAGGMGVVYRAHDPRLERDVAIKVLTPGLLGDAAARARFRTEALALSALNHPNVATVHELGQERDIDFLVMELIPGASLEARLLAGPLPLTELLALGAQFLAGLAAAHARGIVHRDLKPANLFVTPDGRLKILDFGLACLRRATDPTRAPEAAGADRLGGTLPYLAPEQFAEGRTDPRSDLWAAGTVLYEMATGRRAFPGTESGAVLRAILERDPPPPSRLRPELPPGIDRIVLRLLAKNPAARHPDASAALAEWNAIAPTAVRVPDPVPHAGSRLRRMAWWAAGAAALLSVYGLDLGGIRTRWKEYTAQRPGPEAIRTLAVLPFANLSGDPREEYFADGMTEALIADLAKVPGLRVLPRTTMLRFKGSASPPEEIARELRAEGVVEGTVARGGTRVRITARLVQASPLAVLWAESYERPAQDVLALQSAVAQEVAARVRTTLSAEERAVLVREGSVDPALLDLELRARHHVQAFSETGVRQAIGLYQQILGRAPDHAGAHAGLAACYVVWNSVLGSPSAAETWPMAKAAAERALALDESLFGAHLARGWVALLYEWDWARAERHFLRAIELDRSCSDARQGFALFLAARGRVAEARVQARAVLECEPDSVAALTWMGDVHLYLREPAQARALLEKALQIDRNFAKARLSLAWTLELEGRCAEAADQLRTYWILTGFTAKDAEARAETLLAGHRDAGPKGYWRARLALEPKGGAGGDFRRATLHARLGDPDAAFAALHQALDHHEAPMAFLMADPFLDPLHPDPRFEELRNRMRL